VSNEYNISDSPQIKDLISLRQASELCCLSPDHLRRLAEQGKLDAKKIGRNWITTKEAIVDYIKKRKPRGRPKKA
jgi:hypothetical protein